MKIGKFNKYDLIIHEFEQQGSSWKMFEEFNNKLDEFKNEI